MEDWILDSAERPLAHPSVAVIRKWRNKHVAHQDMRQMRMGLAGYEVFPIMPLVRAYWAVMMAAHRVLLLADGSGLHGLYPTPQFSIAKELSGGKLTAVRRTSSRNTWWLARRSGRGCFGNRKTGGIEN